MTSRRRPAWGLDPAQARLRACRCVCQMAPALASPTPCSSLEVQA
jgi:hypothetical protein